MKILRPLKAIRANCIECSGGSRHEVRHCTVPTCPLFPYRMGMGPNTYERRLLKKRPFCRKETAKNAIIGSPDV